jgi:N-acetylglucosaminyldiphosphoundecaprenol N-acetyl-beta-D-mannosaminyltransferase
MGRVYGPDMMAEVCARSVETGETHFLFGATDKTLEKLKESLERRFKGIRIVGTYSPPFRPLTEGEEQDLQQKVSGCKPDFFWVGLSTPKQEKFMAGHCSKEKGGKYPLDTGVMVGVGAAFDFHAGNMKDAPQWIKNIGMQWFYRLCSEPRRLWKRYGYIVPAFMWFNALQYFKCRKYNLTDNSQGDFGRTTKPLDGKSKR